MNLFINRQGQTTGPFDTATVHAKLQSGELSPHDLAWSEGVPDWQPLQALLGAPLPASGQVHSLGHMPPYVGSPSVREPATGPMPPPPSPHAPPQPGPPTPASPTSPSGSGSTTGVSPWLQGIGALLLLLVLWSGRHFFALLGILILPVLLLVSWNSPERLRFLFRHYSEKRIVRGVLGAGIVLCIIVFNHSSATRTEVADGAGASGGATSNATSDKADRRVEEADARALRAEAAKNNAQRDKEQLARQLHDERTQQRASAQERDAQERDAQERDAQERERRARIAAVPPDAGREQTSPRIREGSSENVGNVSVQNLEDIGPREVGTVDQVQYAIVRVERVRQIGTQRADGVYAVLRVVANNTAKKTHDLNTQIMVLRDERDREFDSSTNGCNALMMSGDPSVESLTSVQPDTPKAFSLVFDVPESATGFRLKIPAGTFSLGRAAIIKAPTG